jgi:hypothetical protein
MTMAARLAALLILTATFVLPVETALACSCARLGARELLQQSDAAFIGSMVRSEPFAGEHEIYDRVYTFRVEESFKRDLGREVRLLSGGSCGLYGLKGHLQGYALSDYRPGLYTSDSCFAAEPGELPARRSGPVQHPMGGAPRPSSSAVRSATSVRSHSIQRVEHSLTDGATERSASCSLVQAIAAWSSWCLGTAVACS